VHRLYLEWVSDNPVEVLKKFHIKTITDVFNEFNISFFKSKMNLCNVCEQYKLAEFKEKEELQVKYNEHLFNKKVVENKKC